MLAKVENTLFQFLNDELSLREFENWVYSSKRLESYLGSDLYLDLISSNFEQKGAAYEIKALLRQHLDLGKYETWRIKKLLNDLVVGEGDPVEIIADFYNMYACGYEFLWEIGKYHAFGLDDVPTLSEKYLWNEEAFEKKREAVESYLIELRAKVPKMLAALENGQIKIIGEFEYQLASEFSQEW